MVQHDYTYALGHILTAKHWHDVDPEDCILQFQILVGEKQCGENITVSGSWMAPVLTYDFDKFNAKDILTVMEKYKVTTMCCPPTMYRMLMLEDVSSYDLSSLKYCTIAGEALSPDVFNCWYKATGIKLMEGFGQTETTLTVANLKGMTPKPGSMGKPSPQFNVDIVDEDGNPVPPGVTGEIVLRVKEGEKQVGLFDCYYRSEENTKKSWHDGLYHTGDTAWKDEDGYYWYVGRTDDLIKSSGYRIGPFEIESVLLEHPSVLECAITAVPDAIRGQIVKATIVLREGFTPSEELKKELQKFVKEETAPYKYPRVIDFVDELPKTVSGKIRRVCHQRAGQ